MGSIPFGMAWCEGPTELIDAEHGDMLQVPTGTQQTVAIIVSTLGDK